MTCEIGWLRTSFLSLWKGPDIELIVVQNGRSSENWKWTARGWREPDECHESNGDGWCEEASRERAENEALKFYMEKDE